jgi:hypothetical protein
MGHRVNLAARDTLHRDPNLAGSIKHFPDFLLVGAMVDEDNLKLSPPRHQRRQNRLPPFQLLHPAILNHHEAGMNPTRDDA